MLKRPRFKSVPLEKCLDVIGQEENLLPYLDIGYLPPGHQLLQSPDRNMKHLRSVFFWVKFNHDSPMSFLIRYMVCLWGFFIFPFMNFQTVRGWRFNKIDTFSTDKSLSPMNAINFSLNSSIVLNMYIINISKVQVKYFFNIFLYFFEKGIYNVRGGFN